MNHAKEIRERISSWNEHIFRLVPRTFTAKDYETAFEKLDHLGYEFALRNASSYRDLNVWIAKNIIVPMEGNLIMRLRGKDDITTENRNPSMNTRWRKL